MNHEIEYYYHSYMCVLIVCRQYRERRRQNAVKNAVQYSQRPRKARRVRTQAFYPCPPPSASDMDNGSSGSDDDELYDGFNDALVSIFAFAFARPVEPDRI